MPVEQRTVQPDLLISVPTQVEAMQWTRPNRERVLRWLAEAGALYATDADDDMDLSVITRVHNFGLRVGTPQGLKPVLPGDWVVHGVIGEWYPIADKVRIARYRHAPAGTAGAELGAVREAAGDRDVAERRWRDAIRAAADAGATPATIAKDAGVHPSVVRQILHS